MHASGFGARAALFSRSWKPLELMYLSPDSLVDVMTAMSRFSRMC